MRCSSYPNCIIETEYIKMEKKNLKIAFIFRDNLKNSFSSEIKPKCICILFQNESIDRK